jgi:hypothetical protein
MSNGYTQISSKFYDQFESERKIIIENNKLYESHLERLNRNFCEINSSGNTMGDSLLNLIINGNYIKNDDIVKFSLWNYRCMKSHQKEMLVINLQTKIYPFDRYFHLLVNKYKIRAFDDYLIAYSDTSSFQELEKKFYKNGYFSEVEILKLKNLTTLAVLGHDDIENQILKFILNLYKHSSALFEKDTSPLVYLYTVILRNTLGQLESKNSIVKTLELFENNLKHNNGHDVIMYFDNEYFNSVIKPKIDPNIWMFSRLDRTGQKKSEIIQRILNDDSIWLNDKIMNNQYKKGNLFFLPTDKK